MMTRQTHFFFLAILSVATGAVSPGNTFGQAGLRESLERLDTNNDGRIEPKEITPLARPYLERIGEARRLPLDRTHDISTFQEAARIYHALQNGVAGKDVVPEIKSTIMEFGPRDEPIVPEFGLSEVRYPYTQADLDEADRTLRRYDDNDDGKIDRPEAMDSRWTHRDPFNMDLNKDDRLSRLELAQRYARRRLLSGASEELVQQARRVGNGIKPSVVDRPREDNSQWWKQGGTRTWLTATVLGRFDINRNGRLEMSEAMKLGIPPGQIDVDRDGELTRDELHAFLLEMQDEWGDETTGLPAWFFELDTNRDEQIEMSEFTNEWNDQKMQEFSTLDTNNDGILTAFEVSESTALMGGSYSNNSATMLPPRKTAISEIVIDEDFIIGDLNVKLAITHTNVSHLDAYLVGPDGHRVELFTEVGGPDDHFDDTMFDDQSRFPITKARPPFRGTFLPEAIMKRQPSLSSFNGKNARGTWQLVVAGTRSDRFGFIHNWSLITRPQTEMTGASVITPTLDGPQASLIPQQRDARVQAAIEAKQREAQEADVRRQKSAEWERQKGGYQVRDGEMQRGDEDRRKKDEEEKRRKGEEQIRKYIEHMRSIGKEIPPEKMRAIQERLQGGDKKKKDKDSKKK